MIPLRAMIGGRGGPTVLVLGSSICCACCSLYTLLPAGAFAVSAPAFAAPSVLPPLTSRAGAFRAYRTESPTLRGLPDGCSYLASAADPLSRIARAVNNRRATQKVSALNMALFAEAAAGFSARAAAAARPALGDLENTLRLASSKLAPLLAYAWALLRAALIAFAPSALDVQLVLRLGVAATMGMIIGLERRTSHRPAGVRTM